MLNSYGGTYIETPNFNRLGKKLNIPTYTI